MNAKKKFLSLLLVLCMVLTLMPFPIASAANSSENADGDEDAYTAAVMPGSLAASTVGMTQSGELLSISQLKEKYPAGSKWNGSFDGSIQCAGFARLLCYEAYGSEYYTNNADGKWVKHTNVSYIDTGLKAGDLVRYKNNGHSVFVVGVSTDSVEIADCNYDWANTVRWTTIPKSVLKNGFTHAYSAPYELTSNTVPATPPEITLSQSSVSMQVGGSATVTIGTKSPGSCYLQAYTSNSSVCGGSWGAWNNAGTEKPLTLIGKAEGNATITVYMYDGDSNAELAKKTISVTVTPALKAQISVDTLTTLNRAGTASLYPTVFKGYLRGTAKYDAYSDSSGKNYIGRIYESDELKVQSVYVNNGALWMSALCPWDGYSSDRLIYTRLDAMVDTGFAPYTAIASSSATVYTRSNAAKKYGSLGAGDAVTVIGQSGQYVQVIYPLAVGGYKVGWCEAGCLSRPNISVITAQSSSSVQISYTLPSNAANYLVIAGADGKILLRGSIAGSGVSVTNMSQGVTYYIYIESELTNGTGTVASAVKRIVLK